MLKKLTSFAHKKLVVANGLCFYTIWFEYLKKNFLKMLKNLCVSEKCSKFAHQKTAVKHNYKT